jgi:hypothetical protein
LEIGRIVIRHRGLRDPATRTGTSGGQFANYSCHLRTALEVTDESRQARCRLGEEIEWLIFARGPLSKMKS